MHVVYISPAMGPKEYYCNNGLCLLVWGGTGAHAADPEGDLYPNCIPVNRLEVIGG